MNVLPHLFYGMVVIGSLSMVGDGAGVRGVGRALGGPWEGLGRALGGRWEGLGRALGGPWEGLGRALGGPWEGLGLASGEGRPGSLIYTFIGKSNRYIVAGIF